MSDFESLPPQFLTDQARTLAFIEKNGAKFDGYTPEAKATGVPVPVVSAVDGQIETVDLYCLDAESLLRYIRLDPKTTEHIVFMLLGWSADDYMKAVENAAR